MLYNEAESDLDDSDKEYFRSLMNKNILAEQQKKKKANIINYQAAIARNKRKVDSSSEEEDYHPKKLPKTNILQVRINKIII
jgi:hypothetical protein